MQWITSRPTCVVKVASVYKLVASSDWRKSRKRQIQYNWLRIVPLRGLCYEWCFTGRVLFFSAELVTIKATIMK
jgi:hypothetical protein